MNWKFWKKKKSQEGILKEMRDAEKIKLMELINKNREEGKPESENLIPLRELSYHASLETEEEKKKTEKSNRRSKVEKIAGTLSPFVVMGTALWTTKKDSNGENINKSDGGKRLNRMLDSAASRFTEFKNSFKK